MSRPGVEKPRYPNMFLILGVGGVLAGGVLLLWNLGYLPQLGRLWPIVLLVAGLVFLYLAWPRKHSDTWIIPGMVLTLGGLVLLLANTVFQGGGIKRIWPLFMLVTGVSLIPYALRKRASARAAIIVPAIFISFLALFFLIFSLHGEESGGLVAFVRQWWPMILVVLGVSLIISFFSTRRPSNKV